MSGIAIIAKSAGQYPPYRLSHPHIERILTQLTQPPTAFHSITTLSNAPHTQAPVEH